MIAHASKARFLTVLTGFRWALQTLYAVEIHLSPLWRQWRPITFSPTASWSVDPADIKAVLCADTLLLLSWTTLRIVVCGRRRHRVK